MNCLGTAKGNLLHLELHLKSQLPAHYNSCINAPWWMEKGAPTLRSVSLNFVQTWVQDINQGHDSEKVYQTHKYAAENTCTGTKNDLMTH